MHTDLSKILSNCIVEYVNQEALEVNIRKIIRSGPSRRSSAAATPETPWLPTPCRWRWTNYESRPLRCQSSWISGYHQRPSHHWGWSSYPPFGISLPPSLLLWPVLSSVLFCKFGCISRSLLESADYVEDIFVQFPAVLDEGLYAALGGLPSCELEQQVHHFWMGEELQA